MTSGCGCSLTLAKILLISWCWSHARIRARAETQTPAPAAGIHLFFDRKAWDRCGPWDDIGAGDDDDDDDSLNDHSGSQDADNVDHSHHDNDRVPPGQVHTPDRRGRDIIQGDEVCFLLFSFNILSNHISRTTTGPAVNQSVGTPQGAIILPSEIHHADVPGIHNTGIQTLGHLRRSRLESGGLLFNRIPGLQNS